MLPTTGLELAPNQSVRSQFRPAPDRLVRSRSATIFWLKAGLKRGFQVLQLTSKHSMDPPLENPPLEKGDIILVPLFNGEATCRVQRVRTYTDGRAYLVLRHTVRGCTLPRETLWVDEDPGLVVVERRAEVEARQMAAGDAATKCTRPYATASTTVDSTKAEGAQQTTEGAQPGDCGGCGLPGCDDPSPPSRQHRCKHCQKPLHATCLSRLFPGFEDWGGSQLGFCSSSCLGASTTEVSHRWREHMERLAAVRAAATVDEEPSVAAAEPECEPEPELEGEPDTDSAPGPEGEPEPEPEVESARAGSPQPPLPPQEQQEEEEQQQPASRECEPEPEPEEAEPAAPADAMLQRSLESSAAIADELELPSPGSGVGADEGEPPLFDDASDGELEASSRPKLLLGGYDVEPLRWMEHVTNLEDPSLEHPFRCGPLAVTDRAQPTSLPWTSEKRETVNEGPQFYVGLNNKDAPVAAAHFRCQIPGAPCGDAGVHVELLDAAMLRRRAIEAGNWVRIQHDGYVTEHGRVVCLMRETAAQVPTLWNRSTGERLFVLVLRLSSLSLPDGPWHARAKALTSKERRVYNSGKLLLLNVQAVSVVTAANVAGEYWPGDSADAAAQLATWARLPCLPEEIVRFFREATLTDENTCLMFKSTPRRRPLVGPSAPSGGPVVPARSITSGNAGLLDSEDDDEEEAASSSTGASNTSSITNSTTSSGRSGRARGAAHAAKRIRRSMPAPAALSQTQTLIPLPLVSDIRNAIVQTGALATALSNDRAAAADAARQVQHIAPQASIEAAAKLAAAEAAAAAAEAFAAQQQQQQQQQQQRQRQQHEQETRRLMMLVGAMSAQQEHAQARLDATYRHNQLMMLAMNGNASMGELGAFAAAAAQAAPMPGAPPVPAALAQPPPPPPQQAQASTQLGLPAAPAAAAPLQLEAPPAAAVVPGFPQASPRPALPRFCGHCGQPFASDEVNFCPHCGASRT